jgi:hypothetical protein
MVEDISPKQIKQVAERALVIEYYILQRAWGIGYAIVAGEIVLTTFVPLILLALGVSVDYTLTERLAVNSVGSIIGAVVGIWIFRKAYNAIIVRREIENSIWDKLFVRFRVILVLVAYYLSVLAAVFFLRPHALTVIFGLATTSVFPLVFALKISFPQRLPIEAKVVPAVYALSTISSIIFSLLNTKSTPYIAVWAIMDVVFIWAAINARRHRPPGPLEEP